MGYGTLALLGIELRSVELISLMKFLFTSSEDWTQLANDCLGLSGQEINKYVFSKRNEKIVNTRYSSIEAFVQHYHEDKKGALERLFQEPLTEAKLSRLNCIDDPHTIYEIHSNQNPSIRFMNFVVLV